jgi:hypothetical protein
MDLCLEKWSPHRPPVKDDALLMELQASVSAGFFWPRKVLEIHDPN